MIDWAHEFGAEPGEKRPAPLLRTRVEISARMTVFHAAAGFGKTCAMMDAAERLRRGGQGVIWLSCAALALPTDGVLDAIRRFFALLGEAQTVFVDNLEVLPPNQRKALIEAFSLTEPFRKIVLATRSLEDVGVIRLLAGGQVKLIQADALRWRRRQLAELWQNRLTPKQIDFIDRLAQGWPAVSQLLARFLVEEGNSGAEARLLTGSLVADYIREEVLANFTPDDVALLAMTSQVDYFDDALLRRLADNSMLTCDELVRRLPGLCTHRPEGGCVEYNRTLSLHLQRVFASLPDASRSEALRRSADWASALGDVALAGNLAARAGDRQRIVDYVSKAGGLRIWNTKGYDGLRAVVAAAGERFIAGQPRLKLLKCLVLLKDGQVREAVRLFEEAVPALPSDADTERDVDFVRLSLMVYGCELAIMSDRAIGLAAGSFDRDPAYRQIGPTVLAMMHSQQADFGAANAAISLARAHGREAGTTYNLLFLDIHSVVVALGTGNMDGARAHLGKARLRWRTEFPEALGVEVLILSLGAQLAFERGNTRQARQLIGQVGHRLAHSEAWLDIYFAGYEPMFRLQAWEHGLPTALAAIEAEANKLREAGLGRIAAGLLNIGTCLSGECALRGVAVSALPMSDGVPKGDLESWQEKELRLLAQAYCSLANRKPAEARNTLDFLIAYAEGHGLLRTRLRALLLRQVAQELVGDAAAARADFHAALEIGARTGMLRAFLEFGAEKFRGMLAAGVPESLSAFAKGLASLPSVFPGTRSDSALTRRETQILDLLGKGDSDKGIARKLQVTEFGVRFHLKNIYRKLGVHDRGAAVERYAADRGKGDSTLPSEARDLPA